MWPTLSNPNKYCRTATTLAAPASCRFEFTTRIVQILVIGSTVSLQVRGSIPLFWRQPSAWQLRPPVFLQPTSSHSLQEHATALRTHLCDLVNSYFVPLWSTNTNNGSSGCKGGQGGLRCAVGYDHSNAVRNTASVPRRQSVFMINLVDKKGVQAQLGVLWHRVLQSVTGGGRLQSGGASGQVFPRFGYFHDTPVNYTSSRSTDTVNVTDTSDAALLDRNATTHLHATLEVSQQDLIALHCERNISGAVVDAESESVSCSSRGLAASKTKQCAEPSVDGLTSKQGNATHSVPVDTHLVWFDYHHKCRRSSEATLEIYDILQHAIRSGEGYGVYEHSNHTRVASTQQHVVRTNCMDCLDRTNVLQSVVSRWVLLRQLASLSALSAAHVATDMKIRSMRRNSSVSADDCKDLKLPDQVGIIHIC